MSYIVRRDFSDMQDGGHVYSAGDEFPRTGYTPDPIRIAELSSNSNRTGEPLIECKEEKPEEKPEEVLKEDLEEEPDPAPAPTKKRTTRKK